jgi:predicted RNase H-like nuclease (RuvC/YqgF family)
LPEEPGPLDSNDVRAWRTYADSLRARLQEEIAKNERFEETHKSIMRNHDEMFAEYIASNNALHRQVEEEIAKREEVERERDDARKCSAARKMDIEICEQRIMLLSGAAENAKQRAAALQKELEAVRKDAETLAAIKEVLRCDYDVVAISLAESDWERGYEACHRVVERTIRDAALSKESK